MLCCLELSGARSLLVERASFLSHAIQINRKCLIGQIKTKLCQFIACGCPCDSGLKGSLNTGKHVTKSSHFRSMGTAGEERESFSDQASIHDVSL